MTPNYPLLTSLFVLFALIETTTTTPTSDDDYSSRFRRVYGELNGACRSVKDCGPFGYICKDNRTCDCSEMYKADVYRKLCVGGVDQKCVYDEHCIEGAYCMNQEICRCKESTPFVLDEGMVCARSNIPNTPTFVSFLYVILVFLALVF